MIAGTLELNFLVNLLLKKPLSLPRTPLGICCHALLWWEIGDVKHGQDWAVCPVIMKCSCEGFLQTHFSFPGSLLESAVQTLLETLLFGQSV